ncbi:hypothetical protein [Streptoalloteichus hindustanus]|uniref:Uncharacterized protein n=1 Tax=Streptoalloteichus hindustanus TaxID=2017 RepID=A0A1M5MW40_STRHI|nr:hypothetical protein [Streptoalloteichus hindustanus]SHG81501.1 hypothetical protein SAMN05444320_11475 [Streptoalloteichus hindustanus]
MSELSAEQEAELRVVLERRARELGLLALRTARLAGDQCRTEALPGAVRAARTAHRELDQLPLDLSRATLTVSK